MQTNTVHLNQTLNKIDLIKGNLKLKKKHLKIKRLQYNMFCTILWVTMICDSYITL